MAKRLPNGYGTMPKQMKNGRWRIDVTIKTDTGSVRKSVYGESQEEAIAKKDELKRQGESGVDLLAGKMSLGLWLNKWLETYNKNKRHNTVTVYEATIKNRIEESVKDMPIKKVRNNHLQAMMNRQAEKYSSKTCGLIRTVLKQALDKAVKNQYILTNPAEGIEIPKKTIKQVVPLQKQEVQALLNAVKDTRNYIYYVLSVFTGCRIGEVLGLSWRDIDFKKKIIHIRHSLTYNKNTKEYELGPTKTSETRDIPMLPDVENCLKSHKLIQSKEKLQFGEGFNNQNMVLCSNAGDFMPIATISNEFLRVVDKLGIEASPHSLRHTFASLLISSGANIKLVSNMLGHADTIITLNTYAHLMPGDAEKAMEMVAVQMADIVL